MVGLKTVWSMLITLLFVVSCVPQTKQTQCKSNEAFNSSLRSCVPIVNGPSSFINITSTIPVTSYSRYKNDVTPMQFKVYIDNPYNQTYTTVWKRVFNGLATDITGIIDSPTEWNIYPLYFASQVGLHLINVEIHDANNNIVDTHTFQFTINNSPRPYIVNPISPPTYTVTTTPVSANTQVYSFNVNNNGSSIATASTYQIQWKLLKDGSDTPVTLVPGNVANQNFSSIVSNGINTGTLTFNPQTFGLGNYLLRASVVYTPQNEVVDERQWNITVQHPTHSPVIERALIQNNGVNVLTPVIAYSGIDYNGQTTYNFRPVGLARANFCVKVADGEGAYVGDSKFVKVSFYLDNVGTAIWESYTTAVNNEICLSSAPAGTLSQVLFNNSNPLGAATDHKIFATVYDVATAKQYTLNDLASGMGDYPLYWNVQVRPQNGVPKVAFGTDTVLSNCVVTANAKNGCTVLSDTPFNVTINLTEDDFYYSTVAPVVAYNASKFDFSVKLFRNSAQMGECNKTLNPAQVGPTFTCTLSADGFDTTGPVNPQAPNTYQIKAFVRDTDSPILAIPTTSEELTWNLVVTERNTAPYFNTAPTSNSPVLEGANLQFNIAVNDDQRDNYSYQIKYCKDAACTPSLMGNLTPVVPVTRASNALTNNVISSTTLPEDFLLNVTGVTGCGAVARGASCTVNFFVEVKDVPSNPGTVTSYTLTSAAIPVTITNVNANPVFNMSLATPVPPGTITVMSGMPFSISASALGVITDTSIPGTEKVSRYQWYAKQNADSVWTAISNSDGPDLVWTPSLMSTTGIVNIMLCVQDQPAAIVATPGPTNTPAFCSTAYNVNVRNNLVQTTTTPIARTGSESGQETAVWAEAPVALIGFTGSTAYQAYLGNDNLIYVKRNNVVTEGRVVRDAFITSFTAFDQTPTPVSLGSIKDLSIYGSGDHLYVAYLASTSLAPTSFYPQVRRIDISTGKITPNIENRKMGFSYDGVSISTSCTGGPCTVSNPLGGANATITFSGTATTGSLTIMGEVINFASFPAPAGSICGNCDSTVKATDLANIINSSQSLNLPGITATAAGSVVTIFGSTSDDYFDGRSMPNAVFQAGSIFVTSGKWYLPYIDGASNRINFLTGPATGNMTVVGSISITNTSNSDLNNLNAATRFSNYLDGTTLYIALSTNPGSIGKLYKFATIGANFANTSLDIMTGSAIVDLQVTSNTTNTFVLAKIVESPVNYRVGIYSNSATPTLVDEFKMDDSLAVDAPTRTHFNGTNIANIRIVAATGAGARIFASITMNSSDYYLYMAKVHVNSSPEWGMTCYDCNQVSNFGLKVSPAVKFKSVQLRQKVASDPLYVIGSAGSTLEENIRNVAFIGLGQMDLGGLAATPYFGVFNIEPEQVPATTVPSSATPGAEDIGLFRSPFIKN